MHRSLLIRMTRMLLAGARLSPARAVSSAYRSCGAPLTASASSVSRALPGRHTMPATSAFAHLRRFGTTADSEPAVGDAPMSYEFQTETKRLLEIVARSLYTERNVFVRELISNASDAIEKLRTLRQAGAALAADIGPEEVILQTDPQARTFAIEDHGVGMTRDELVRNLGTIAHSGSREFVHQMNEHKDGPADPASIIGQFGVGFYSAFVVAERVQVYSRSALAGSQGYCWESDGLGTFTVRPAPDLPVGTRIVLHLRPTAADCADEAHIEELVRKYSNFVNFPILLNGERVNLSRALWLVPPNEIAPAEYTEFYRLVAQAQDEPRAQLHYTATEPSPVRALLFIPQHHTERYGMPRMEPGYDLYCRRVLVQKAPHSLLPPWLRFLKGVVDCEDIPINISRESLQDAEQVRKVGKALTQRIIRWFAEMQQSDPIAYASFFEEYGYFLKEGMWSDFPNKDLLAPLLQYETSRTAPGQRITLAEYVARMPPHQKEIYYICSPSREHALNSPYMEALKAHQFEVLLGLLPVDEMVMQALMVYDKRQVVAAEMAKLDIGQDAPAAVQPLSGREARQLAEWMESVLGDERVKQVTTTGRLRDSPAIIAAPENALLRRLMKITDTGTMNKLPRQKLEINPGHPVIVRLQAVRHRDEPLARAICEQVYENALIAAGLLEDPRAMLERMNMLLLRALDSVPQA